MEDNMNGKKTAKAVTGSVEEWTGFLQLAARLYKYSYPEQLLIYAQRPDATACASYEIWNQTMRRYVRRGARGIALPDGAGCNFNPRSRVGNDVLY